MSDIHFHWRWLHFPLNAKLSKIYLTTLLRSFALSLVSIFVPVYLIKIGYPLDSALVFLMLFYIGITLASPFAAWLSSRIGSIKTIANASLFTISYLLLLRLLAADNVLLFHIVPFVGAIGVALFWIPMNSFFVRSKQKKVCAEQTAIWSAVSCVASAVGPVLGGVVLTFLNFNSLFVLASVVLGLSILPLMQRKEIRDKFKLFLKKSERQKFGSWFKLFFVQGLLFTSVDILYPIYVYLTSKSFTITGATASVLSVSLALTSVVIGKLADRLKRAVSVAGAVTLSLTSVFLLLFKNPIFVILASFPLGAGWAAISIPLFAFFSNELNKSDALKLMAYRDIYLGLGRATAFLIFLLVSFGKFNAVLTMAFLTSLFFVI